MLRYLPRCPLLLLAVLLLSTTSVAAQLPPSTDPAQRWQSFRSANFRVHFRAEHTDWARHVAERLEGIRVAVGREVGYVPPTVTDVVIDDPLNLPNGSAMPFMDGPVMFFWPTPPDPASGLSQQSTWGELLAIHEFAHIAHLSRPARDPWERIELLFPLLPRIGPIPRRVPTWVTEGYATLVEGRLSASGRPNSVWRAAVLRTWALEGTLPAYASLDEGGAFLGGSTPYLTGSAYLEWLARARGDSALPQLWRRLTARVARDFPEAFTGTFGDSPAALYGRFTAEVSARAFAVRATRTSAGLVEGERIARLERGAGAPAVSPDGSRMALLLSGAAGSPSRIEIWSTRAQPADSAELRETQRMLDDDPDDVAAYMPYPRRPRAISTLWPVRGRGHSEPRFLPDGRRLLVTRMEPLPSGALRPDLFIWDPRLNAVTRVTNGAGIRLADPTPDGAHAAGIRCGAGSCDLVEIVLETGAVRVLTAGSPTRTFGGARVSPDGRTVATALHEAGRWRIALVQRADGAMTIIDPRDQASRYAPAWMPDGRALAVVSEAGGIADIERLALDGTTTPLTRVLTATQAPDASATGDRVWYLALHARGWDLRALSLGGPPLARAGDITADAAVIGARADPALTNPPAPAAVLPVWPVGDVEQAAYGLGPRGWRLLPTSTSSASGTNGGLALYLVDPVGRLGLLAQGAGGDRSAWQGGSLAISWRGTRPTFELAGYWAREEGSRGTTTRAGSPTLDLEQSGGALTVALDRASTLGGHHYAGGVLAGRVSGIGASATPRGATRAFAWLEAGHRYLWVRGGDLVFQLESSAQLAQGTTNAVPWTRAVASLLLRTGGRRLQLEASGTYGRVNGGAPATEQLQLGGMTTSLLPTAAQSQRFDQPAFAPGALIGREAARTRLGLVSGPITVFWDALAAGGQFAHAGQWWRVAGIDARVPLDPAPLLRLPAVELRAGAGYAFDDVVPASWRAWFMLSARP